MALTATEAGLLIDAAEPWAVHVAGRRPGHRHPLGGYVAHGKVPPQEAIDAWRAHYANEARAKRVQRAWRRLAALGLVRVGRLHPSYGRTVIERTDAGSALLARRHNELHAVAERGNGGPAGGMTFWRGGGCSLATRDL